jgi:hypothetical protein
MKRLSIWSLRFLVLPLVWTAALSVHAKDGDGFVASEDGASVLQPQTKLIWRRCAEGVQWNGASCEGTPLLLTRGEAQTLAGARAKAEGLAWRVPHSKELQRLARATAQPQESTEAVFPAAPTGWHWSATVSVDTSNVNQYDYKNIERGVTPQNANRIAFLHGWAVNLLTGEAREDVLERTKLPVRLVREMVVGRDVVKP